MEEKKKKGKKEIKKRRKKRLKKEWREKKWNGVLSDENNWKKKQIILPGFYLVIEKNPRNADEKGTEIEEKKSLLE